MTDPHEPPPLPVLALTVAEAARSIGVTENTFRRHVLTDLRSISAYMGHASVAFTIDRYGHLLPDAD